MPSDRRVQFTPAASADFDDIADFTLERWGPLQVNTYMARILDGINHLARFPEMGRDRSDIAPGLYSFPLGERVVFYRFSDQSLIVRRIMHKRQLLKSIDLK